MNQREFHFSDFNISTNIERQSKTVIILRRGHKLTDKRAAMLLNLVNFRTGKNCLTVMAILLSLPRRIEERRVAVDYFATNYLCIFVSL